LIDRSNWIPRAITIARISFIGYIECVWRDESDECSRRVIAIDQRRFRGEDNMADKDKPEHPPHPPHPGPVNPPKPPHPRPVG
jgi:hypothetical protein